MRAFEYRNAAELFSVKSWKWKGRAVRYRRFPIAAEAIRFAIEDLPPQHLVGAYLEVEESRFDSDGIRRLYESADYPLKRRAAPSKERAPDGNDDAAARNGR